MKILLIGSNGQLGTDLQPRLREQGDTVVALDHNCFEISDPAQIEAALDQHLPDAVINTSAFHKVEQCEVEALRAFEVNAVAPRNLAVACRKRGAVLVHFSTDYVFSGSANRPYQETDATDPLSVYGTSKLAGEKLVAAYGEKYILVRTCGLYGVAGSSGKGGNFVETMLKKAAGGETIRVVDDQVLTPTFTGDLAAAVARLIHTSAHGLYHISAEGQCSWYEFARKIFELSGLKVDLRPVKTAEFASPVRRPAFSVLSKNKLNAVGITMPGWEEGLRRYLLARTQRGAPA